MAIQIANPVVVEKIERLAKDTGLSKTAAVEKAVDRLLATRPAPAAVRRRLQALLEQIDRIPDLSDAFEPIEWDEHGLPG
ncbi:MAG: type II toxin-antitoxin system VapB family antitoxin [Burkholderiaceae bacterium]|nr:type II toxin-antitoxin system VapB family antitoxin [Burkholderiaceae bacterium]